MRKVVYICKGSDFTARDGRIDLLPYIVDINNENVEFHGFLCNGEFVSSWEAFLTREVTEFIAQICGKEIGLVYLPDGILDETIRLFKKHNKGYKPIDEML
jgi:hypothetical protein